MRQILQAKSNIKLTYYFLSTKKILKGSWALLKVWDKIEHPEQVPSFSPDIVKALMGLALASGDLIFAALIGVGFHCVLRTGENLSLSWATVLISKTLPLLSTF